MNTNFACGKVGLAQKNTGALKLIRAICGKKAF
jgi:hypothetical protein